MGTLGLGRKEGAGSAGWLREPRSGTAEIAQCCVLGLLWKEGGRGLERFLEKSVTRVLTLPDGVSHSAVSCEAAGLWGLLCPWGWRALSTAEF